MRIRAKKDDNHKEIVKTFRQLGFSVFDTAQLGGGFADLVVGLCGINILVEVKDGRKVPSACKLTPDELEFSESWQGWYTVVEGNDDVLRLFVEVRQIAMERL